MEFYDLRGELDRVDAEILRRVADRLRLARRIEEEKARTGRPIRDFQREREVLERAGRLASELGLDPTLARRLLAELIRSSLTVQERQRVEAAQGGSGRRALVIGGAGRMGGWFCRFLAGQGYAVEVADPRAEDSPWSHRPDWATGALDHDLLVVATPLRPAAGILEELADRRPPGVVLEIGSVKRPLLPALENLVAADVDVASIHPLFGPDAELLSGRHVVVIDVGRPRATELARELFGSTMAALTEMDLEEHDRLMAWVLGLSHATSIAYAAALSASGESAARLAGLASTTFADLAQTASRVVRENPHLYYEIQRLNRHDATAIEALTDSLARLRAAVAADDEAAFVELMEAARDYLGGVPGGEPGGR